MRTGKGSDRPTGTKVVSEFVDITVQQELPTPPGVSRVRQSVSTNDGGAVLGERVVPFRGLAEIVDGL